MKPPIILLVAALSLAACAVGPDYKAPPTPPATLVNAQSSERGPLTSASPDGLWWQQFDDPTLEALVTDALSANLDLRVAVDRVRAARAAFSGAEYDYGPHLPLTAGFTGSKEQEPGFGNQRINAEGYTVGFDATWELDLFGHVRRSVEAARSDLGAEQALLNDAQITVAAEVARNYFSLRSTQQQIDVANRNLVNQQQTVRFTEVRFESGRGNELDLDLARARLKATEATLPVLYIAQAAAAYRLAVLLGQRPGSLEARLAPRAIPAYAKALPIGSEGTDASALLRNRPDVRAAERRLAAATARVGIATADLFPRVSITGFVGFLSGDFSHLFSTSPGTDARAWSVAPSINWPALDYGSVHTRLIASRANADAELANYQKTVLTALEETENAFVAYREQQSRLKSLMEQASASRRAAELAALQYREGVADFLTLLDAQRTQLAAESDVAATEGEVNISVVSVYKALGGVGQPPPPRVASAR
jgi:outer membrane protein, multidrug efflux system